MKADIDHIKKSQDGMSSDLIEIRDKLMASLDKKVDKEDFQKQQDHLNKHDQIIWSAAIAIIVLLLGIASFFLSKYFGG